MPSSQQSPVDIPSTAPRHREGITWAYRMTRVRTGENPDAVQFDCEPGCALVIRGVRYELRREGERLRIVLLSCGDHLS